MKALNYQGGPNERYGGQKILLRAAVAALLNAAHPGLDYPMTEQQVINQVNSVLATQNRNTMIMLAARLDRYNNFEGDVCDDHKRTATPVVLSGISGNVDPQLLAVGLPNTGGLTGNGISDAHWLALAFALLAASATIASYYGGNSVRRNRR